MGASERSAIAPAVGSVVVGIGRPAVLDGGHVVAVIVRHRLPAVQCAPDLGHVAVVVIGERRQVVAVEAAGR